MAITGINNSSYTYRLVHWIASPESRVAESQ